MQHHPMAVSAHPAYAPYQHAYIQARQPVMHPQHPQSNPYPSPGPPPPAPPPQGPWGQSHPQQQHPQPTSHQLPPPPQQQHVQQPPHYQQQQQQPSISSAPSHMVQHHHNQPPHQNSHPPMQHHPIQQQAPPPPQQQLQQQQQQQFQPQQQQPPAFARTTAIVPTTVDSRDPYAVNEPNRQPLTAPLTRNDTLMEVKLNQYTQNRSRYSIFIRSRIDVLSSTSLLVDMVRLSSSNF